MMSLLVYGGAGAVAEYDSFGGWKRSQIIRLYQVTVLLALKSLYERA
jgi:hypothetical protein